MIFPDKKWFAARTGHRSLQIEWKTRGLPGAGGFPFPICYRGGRSTGSWKPASALGAGGEGDPHALLSFPGRRNFFPMRRRA